MKNNNLEWLLNWFYEHCDGDWEHDDGIQIGTLDNPGWYLTINLKNTELETKFFKEIFIERSENDWLHCFIKDGKFEGPCGLFNLQEVMEIFRNWTLEQDKKL